MTVIYITRTTNYVFSKLIGFNTFSYWIVHSVSTIVMLFAGIVALLWIGC